MKKCNLLLFHLVIKMKECDVLLFHFACIRLENLQSKKYVLMGASTEEIPEALHLASYHVDYPLNGALQQPLCYLSIPQLGKRQIVISYFKQTPPTITLKIIFLIFNVTIDKT